MSFVSTASLPRLGRVALVLGFASFGLLIVSLAYKNGFDFKCGPPAPKAFCVFASTSVPRAIGVMVALCFFFLARSSARIGLSNAPGRTGTGFGAAAIGLAVMMVPWLALSGESDPAFVLPAAMAGMFGACVFITGLAIVLASPDAWLALFRRHWLTLLALTAIGSLLPEVVNYAKATWTHNEALRTVTFDSVLRVLDLWGYQVAADPVERVIGAGDFFVRVNQSCSGTEGLVLTTAFVAFYLVLFRSELRFPHVLLILPIGLLGSWIFNVLRISILLAIGLEGNPELAVGGFHSHAGWFMFTLVSLAIIAMASCVPAFRKAPVSAAVATRPAQIPFLHDPLVAKILPFAVFMLSALLASTLSQNPGTLYPLRVMAVGAALALFLPLYKSLTWRLDPTAVVAGLAVGLAWVLVPVEPAEGPPPYGTLAGAGMVLWFVARAVGTSLLVPAVEELFFRDYLESRLRIGRGPAWAVFAAVVSAGIFAALHDRWAEAFAAGLVFSLLARRRGLITDAILAHAVANAFVFATAVVVGNLALI